MRPSTTPTNLVLSQDFTGISDPYFNNVVLLLNGDGTNGAQNNTFIDSSTNNFTITRNGNVTQGSFSPYGDRWSAFFDGTGDFLGVASGSAFDFGTGDWTIEAWVFIAGNTTANVDNQRDGTIFTVRTGNTVHVQFGVLGDASTTGTGLQIYNTSAGGNMRRDVAISQNTWHHIAAVRNQNNLYIYLNGSQVGAAFATTLSYGSSTGTVQVGQSGVTNYIHTFNGYISNLRILKGTALYTSSFTPPTSPLTAITNTSLLACHANRFVDGSSNNFAITCNGDTRVERFSPFAPTAEYSTSVIGGSAYFDGSGDYLSVPELSFASNFTAECWFYRGANATIRHMLFGTTTSRNSQLAVSNNGEIFVAQNAAILTGFNNVGGNCVPQNTWNHIAFVRSGTNFSVFVNGTRIANGTSTAIHYINYVGGYGIVADQTYAVGYISNARVTSTAVYDPSQTNITVPTSPLTAVTNTSLLLNAVNAGIVDATAGNVLETVGNAQVSTVQKKYGTGALYFDGNGDSLGSVMNQSFAFGTGDFTIEFWIYFISIGSFTGILDIRNGVTAAAQALIYLNGTTLTYYASNAIRITGSTMTSGTWRHIAVSRSSGTTRLFVDGTQSGSSFSDSINYIANPIRLGAFSDSSIDRLNGYIDDLRITKGVARYTSHFTPPVSALPLF